jgi:serine/threonine protein phosphatase PrpC
MTRQAKTAYGMLVADGMDGHAAGEVASRAAIRFLMELVLSTPDWMMCLDDRGRKEVLRRTEQRLRQVADLLTEMALNDPDLFGMGTTMTLTFSLGWDMITGHIGDSRAYLLRDGQLKRLTRDHTVVQELIDRGVIAPAEAAIHPMRHLLLNVIGTQGNPVHADIGLTDMISDSAIAEILGRSVSAEEACQALLDTALEAGGNEFTARPRIIDGPISGLGRRPARNSGRHGGNANFLGCRFRILRPPVKCSTELRMPFATCNRVAVPLLSWAVQDASPLRSALRSRIAR